MKPPATGLPAYAIEGALLAVFMVSASAFTILVEHPRGLLSAAIADPIARRVFVGLAMGLTAVVLIYSRWGSWTGAHMNPAVTLSIGPLRGMPARDVAGYVLGQFAGGIAGMAVAAALFGPSLSHASVNWVVTRPGSMGIAMAFAAEVAMTTLLMTIVLRLSAHPLWGRRIGVVSGALLASFITVEAPLSGMSLNPARSLGPALFAGDFSALWVYFLAPPLGMGLAAWLVTWRCPDGACPHGFHGAHS